MKRDLNTSRVYNLLFPVWLLVWFPSWLWLVLVPANYLVDRLVLAWSLDPRHKTQGFCRAHTWKICLAGFASDFAASAALLGAELLLDSCGLHLTNQMSWAIMFNPFGHIGGLALTLLSVAAAGCLIYLFDQRILVRAGIDTQQARHCALRLALVTAPYLFLFPSELLYQ